MTPPIERLWDKRNRIGVLAASASMIAAIALVDWWTTPYVSLGFLYMFPIMLAAGYLPRAAMLALSVVCAGLSESFGSLDPAWRISRLSFQVLALASCGLFVSELLRNRRLNLEGAERLRALVDTSPAAIVLTDQKGLIELANQAAVKMMAPGDAGLKGQAIGTYLPALENALRSGQPAQCRTAMQCEGLPGDGGSFTAEVWFSTYEEEGASRLAAIIADVSDERPPELPSCVAEPPGAERPSFNSRQIAVLRLLFEGLPNREIAGQLGITPSAVKNTLQQLFSRAGVTNRSQLVRVALEQYRDLL